MREKRREEIELTLQEFYNIVLQQNLQEYQIGPKNKQMVYYLADIFFPSKGTNGKLSYSKYYLLCDNLFKINEEDILFNNEKLGYRIHRDVLLNKMIGYLRTEKINKILKR